MILEVIKWPESQEYMDKEGWFFVEGSNYFSEEEEKEDVIGQAAYGRVLDKKDYILVEKTTADEYNEDFITLRDPGDEHVDYGPPYTRANPNHHKKRGRTRRRDDRRHNSRRKATNDRRGR
ncbi:MAG: hypothetical protein CMI54_07205 [Parcubacteria group bacterium]|jgi:hypothetical protein|nr:hypothetical protein [Parcubacteria group bacterium]|tara:strand:+ start:11816 stop:12178 length:363 start_codon:yes stop_codon:yes gene_type:complete